MQTNSVRNADEIQEVHDLIATEKRHPSLQPGSNEAGPPIHVNPYPQVAGKGSGMAGMAHLKPEPQAAPTHGHR